MGFADQRFNVNLSILFTELPLLERPAAAAAAGFTAVELWWPWIDSPTPEQSELDALKSAIEDAGVQLTGLNFYAGQLPGPDRGALSIPGEESERFRANIDVAADFARSLGCTALNALYGNRVEGVDPAEQDRLALENLVLAARAADRIGAVLLVEALNKPESPRYPLVSAPAAIAVVDRVNEATGLGNAKFLMDLYHLSMNGEDLPQVIDAYAAKTGHVQIADNPGRGAPGTGSSRWRTCSTASRRPGTTAGSAWSTSPATTPAPSPSPGCRPGPARPAERHPQNSSEIFQRGTHHEHAPQGRLDRSRHHGLAHVREPDQGGLPGHRLHPGAGEAGPPRRRRRRVAGSIAEAVRDADVVVTMVPASPQVEAIAYGPDGILENAKSGALLVDMSSITPQTSVDLAKAAKDKGIRVLDAPVSGGEAGAIEAVLSIMVGGEQADFDEAKPLLEALGKTIVLCGPHGSGQTVKAANQLIVAVNIQACAEAVVFLEKSGVDLKAALDVLNGGLAGSTVLTRKKDNFLGRDFKPGFRIDLHHKDMGIVTDAARNVGAALPVGAVVAQLVASLRAQGDGGLDHSALLRAVERLSGDQV